jgi:hypothetical protein
MDTNQVQRSGLPGVMMPKPLLGPQTPIRVTREVARFMTPASGPCHPLPAGTLGVVLESLGLNRQPLAGGPSFEYPSGSVRLYRVYVPPPDETWCVLCDTELEPVD